MHSSFGMFLMTNELGKNLWTTENLVLKWDSIMEWVTLQSSPLSLVYFNYKCDFNFFFYLILDEFTLLGLSLCIFSLVENIFSVS